MTNNASYYLTAVKPADELPIEIKRIILPKKKSKNEENDLLYTLKDIPELSLELILVIDLSLIPTILLNYFN